MNKSFTVEAFKRIGNRKNHIAFQLELDSVIVRLIKWYEGKKADRRFMK